MVIVARNVHRDIHLLTVLRVALVRVINLVQNHAHKVVLYPTHRLVHTAARPHLVPNIMVVRAMHLIQATVQ